MTWDDPRQQSFGTRGDSNHVYLRFLFPKLSIAEAIQYLEMIVDDAHDPNISDGDMREAFTLAANYLLKRFTDIDLEAADAYLTRFGSSSYAARLQTKKREEDAQTAEQIFVERFVGVTGSNFEMAHEVGQKFRYQNVEQAVNQFFGENDESPL